MKNIGSAELDSEKLGILVPWSRAAQRSYLKNFLYGTQNPCLFSESVKNLDTNMLIHLNTKSKLKGHYQCFWSNLVR